MFSKSIARSDFVLCSVLLLTLLVNGRAEGALIMPDSDAVLFEQIDFRDGGPGNSGVNSCIGQITIDIAKVNDAVAGFESGYVNVADGSGNWVVRNLPIFDSSFYDHPTITTKLNLGVADNTDLSTFDAHVDYSSTPLTAFSGGPTYSFSVGDVSSAIGGFIDSVAGYLSPLDLSVLDFITGGLIEGVYQKGHKNEQTANNQCAPMSIANSLQWLKDRKGITLEHEHKKGLKGDDSLVGKLDTYMDRGVRSRQDGDPVGAAAILEGKLEYASKHKLKFLNIKHQGMLGGGDVSHHGLTSTGKGTTINIDWIISELEKDEDVEMGYLFGGGGHFVEITGGGRILGIPWITYLSDHRQTDRDPTDTLGTDKIDFTFLWGNRMIFEPDNANMAFVISQSIPEPATLALLFIGGLVVRRQRRS